MQTGLVFCLLSLLLCAFAARRSVGLGISMLWIIGCFYGILRANFLDGFSHFIFDAGVLGFYAVRFSKSVSALAVERSIRAKRWLAVLAGWPVLLFLIPINHYLIQLVALRHIIFFLPAMLFGARARLKDLETITNTLAIVNVIAFGFSLAEYELGIQPFFPRNAVTEILYHSHDIKTAAGTFYRIPSIFTSAHAYGLSTIGTLPFLLNVLADKTQSSPRRLATAGVVMLSVMGVFLSGTRLSVIVILGSMLLMMVLPGLNFFQKALCSAAFLIIGLLCTFYIVSDERLQRFTSLSDTQMVEKRTGNSLSFPLGETVLRYPMGAGLGSVMGASIPYFLKDLAPAESIGAEDEYVRIAVEQGIVGFGFWVVFLFNFALRKPLPIAKRWQFGTHAMWAFVLTTWCTAFIGVGALQSIPGSFLMLFVMGLLLRQKEAQSRSSDTLVNSSSRSIVTNQGGIAKLPIAKITETHKAL